MKGTGWRAWEAKKILDTVCDLIIFSASMQAVNSGFKNS
jgi:hypothetical protein